MKIYDRNDNQLLDVLITQAAEHEQELMKSDFVKLQWNSTQSIEIPVDAYIQPFAVDDGNGNLSGDLTKYYLFEPYTPTQKSEVEWTYEPHFHHEKMRLGKVTFSKASSDDAGNVITLLDWSYTGSLETLLKYFCDAIDEVFGLESPNQFNYEIIQPKMSLDAVVTATFSTQDILSALSNVANVEKCEWHIDWNAKMLYFGNISLNPSGLDPFEMVVGQNVQVPSIVRNSKDGYWNAFQPQGSTRNLTRRAATGENVQATKRLDLRGYEEDNVEKFPDGIIYTDGNGETISKEDFEDLGCTPYIKSLIFDGIYPKMNLYVYNVRWHEYFMTDGDGEKVIGGYDGNGQPVYKKAADWYIRLAYPTGSGNNITWHDYQLTDEVFAEVSSITNERENYYTILLDMTYVREMFEDAYYAGQVLEHRCTLKHGNNTVKAAARGYDVNGKQKVQIILHTTRDTDVNISAFINGLSVEDFILFVEGDYDIYPDKAPSANVASSVISGKELYGAFQPNNYAQAESCPLAGRGEGDSGYYGFELEYIKKGEKVEVSEGDTFSSNFTHVDNDYLTKDGDYRIRYQQNDNFVLPTTIDGGLIPKGVKVNGNEVDSLENLVTKSDGKKGNIVNLYNIVMDEQMEQQAQSELVEETEKYIARQFENNDSYTCKSNPIAFKQMFDEDEDNNTDSHLFIGQTVILDDGLDLDAQDRSAHRMQTRVMKIVSKLDYDFEQEITVGNKVIKGSQTMLKEQVETIIGGAGGGTGGGSVSEAQIRNVLEAWTTPRFLSKLNNDTARGFIRMLQGMQVGNVFTSGILGTGGVFRKEGDGTTYIEADKLYVRVKAYFDSVEIREYRHSGGNRVASDAGLKCVRVENYGTYNSNTVLLDENNRYHYTDGQGVEHITEPLPVDFYRCYFRASDGEDTVINNFVAGDLAYCHITSVTGSTDTPEQKGLNQKHYWRLVIGRNTEGTLTSNDEGWIDLSNKTDAETGKPDTELIAGAREFYYPLAYQEGSDAPAAQDDIIQLGHVYDKDRQGAIIEYVTGANSPAYQIYQGIGVDTRTAQDIEDGEPFNPYVLTDKNYITIGYNSQTKRAEMKVYGDMYIGAKSEGGQEPSTYIRYTQEHMNGATLVPATLEIKAMINASSTIGNQSIDNYIANNAQINAMIGDLQEQIDGAIETYYMNGVPSLSTPPVVSTETARYDEPWLDGTETEEERTAILNNHVGDLYYDKSTGHGYRFLFDNEDNTFAWVELTDEDVTEALRIANEARSTADGKSTIFLNNPNDSDTSKRYPTNYKEGDMWILPVNATINSVDYLSGDVLTTSSDSETYVASHWSKKVRYTDDSRVEHYMGILAGGSLPQNPSNKEIALAAEAAIRNALGSGTIVDGGLLLTSLIGMRKKNQDDSYTTWAGISGEYDASVLGGGIAAWYGGNMLDKETLADGHADWNTLRWAKSLFRFDGSGYFADGNITWNAAGAITIKNITTLSDSNNVNILNELATFNSAFTFATSGQGSTTALSITPMVGFTSLDIIDNTVNPSVRRQVATQKYVDDNYVSKAYFRQLFRAFKPNSTSGQPDVEVQPNTIDNAISNIKAMVGLWTEQYLSALGQNSSGGSGGGGGVTMTEVWTALNGATSEPINITHLTGALTNYALKSNTVADVTRSSGRYIVTFGDGTYHALAAGATVIDIADYAHANGVLPVGDGYVYVYNGLPVEYRNAAIPNTTTQQNENVMVFATSRGTGGSGAFPYPNYLYVFLATGAYKATYPWSGGIVPDTFSYYKELFGWQASVDADTLDGHDSSYFAIAGALDNYLTKNTSQSNLTGYKKWEKDVGSTPLTGNISTQIERKGLTLTYKADIVSSAVSHLLDAGANGLQITNLSATPNPTTEIIATREWVAANYTPTTDTDTWRDVYVGGSQKATTSIESKAINFVAGSNATVTYQAAGTSSGQSGSVDYFNVKIDALPNGGTVGGNLKVKTALLEGYVQLNADGSITFQNGSNSAPPAISIKQNDDGRLASGINVYAYKSEIPQTGYSSSGKNYAVQLSSNKMYVNVPWTDTVISNYVTTDSNQDDLGGAKKWIKGYDYQNREVTKGAGNVATEISIDGIKFYTKDLGDSSDTTFLLSASKSGGLQVSYLENSQTKTKTIYHAGNAGITNGTITIGSNSITPITSLSGYATESWVGSNYIPLTGAKLVTGYLQFKALADQAEYVKINTDGTITFLGSDYGLTAISIGQNGQGRLASGSNVYAYKSEIPTVPTATNYDRVLSWGTNSVVATFGSVDIKVGLPANPVTYGNTAGTSAEGNHTHSVGISSVIPSGATVVELSENSSYALSAGGSMVYFKTPANVSNYITTNSDQLTLGGAKKWTKDESGQALTVGNIATKIEYSGITFTAKELGSSAHSYELAASANGLQVTDLSETNPQGKTIYHAGNISTAPTATTSVAGLLSASDKTKLNAIDLTGTSTLVANLNADKIDGKHLGTFYKHGYASGYGDTTKPYRLVGEATIANGTITADNCTTFFVSEYYNGAKYGILGVRFRAATGSATPGWLHLDWAICNDININNFIATWERGTNNFTIRLYCKCTDWVSWAFRKLDEQNWGREADVWTMHNAQGTGDYCYASIPNTETQVVSTTAVIKNKAMTAGDADTLDGLHASDFLSSSVLADYLTKNTSQSNLTGYKKWEYDVGSTPLTGNISTQIERKGLTLTYNESIVSTAVGYLLDAGANGLQITNLGVSPNTTEIIATREWVATQKASDSALGGVMTGYQNSLYKYAVSVNSDGRAYVDLSSLEQRVEALERAIS